jgi:hypothetical protein
MRLDTKRKVGSIILFLSSFIYLGLAYVGFSKQNIDLRDYDKIEGVIADIGIDYRLGSKGRKSECFFILLKSMEKKLGVYRMSKDYQDLIDRFAGADSVTVYYKSNNNNSERINIDLIQVESKGTILLDKKEYEGKESFLIYIGLFAGISSVILSILFYFGKLGNTTKNYR